MKNPNGMPTLIGSLPLTEPQEAVDLVLSYLEEAPIWPELPRRSFWEGMVTSHCDGLPGLVAEESSQRFHVDTGPDSADPLALFYSRVFLAEEKDDLSAFALSPRHASALELTAQTIAATGKRIPCIKVHCIGPVSFGLQLTDGHGRPLFYEEAFQDVLLRQVTLQTRWMVRRFKPMAETIVVFFDEPSLAAFGTSSLIGVSRESVVHYLKKAISAVTQEGAVVGVHVCGNTDWSMIMDSGTALISYDAYSYGESLLAYLGELTSFLQAGGIVAWGIVPTSQKILEESAKTLSNRFQNLIQTFEDRGIDRRQLLNSSMITPSCGMGTLAVEPMKQIIEHTVTLSRLVRSWA